MRHQCLNGVHIALERSQMKWSELIRIGDQVCPLFDLLGRRALNLPG